MDWIITWILVIAFLFIAFGRLFGTVAGLLRDLWEWLGIGR